MTVGSEMRDEVVEGLCVHTKLVADALRMTCEKFQQPPFTRQGRHVVRFGITVRRRFKSGTDGTSNGDDDDVEQECQVAEDALPLLWSD